MNIEGTRPIRGVGSGARRAHEVDDLELAQRDGVAIHALIGAVCARFGPAARPAEILEIARGLGSQRLAPVYRQAKRQRVVTATTRYFARFGPNGWLFRGSEVIVGDVALDLLWERDGRLMADEIKTGAVSVFGTDDLERQVAAQLAASRAEWGSSFVGVRSIRLMDPEESRMHD